MPKRVIISQDYDGCFDACTEAGVEAQIRRVNPRYFRNNRVKQRQIKGLRLGYLGFLQQLVKGADSVSVYVGSDRQSYFVDRDNMINNKDNGSVFTALDELCRNPPKSSLQQKWTFEPLLMADPIGQRGKALERIFADLPEDEQLDVGPTNWDHAFLRSTAPGRRGLYPSKIHMLYRQMWDAYNLYGEQDDELEFVFIDDNAEVLDNIIDVLDPSQIPPGMTVRIFRFDNMDYVTDFIEPHEEVEPIKSSRLTPKETQECLAKMKLVLDKVAKSINDYLKSRKRGSCLNIFSIRNRKITLAEKMLDELYSHGTSLDVIKEMLLDYAIENEELQCGHCVPGANKLSLAIKEARQAFDEEARQLQQGQVVEAQGDAELVRMVPC